MVWQLFSASLSSSGARSSAQRPVAGTSRSLSLASDTGTNSRQHRLRIWLVRIMGIQGASAGRRVQATGTLWDNPRAGYKAFRPEGICNSAATLAGAPVIVGADSSARLFWGSCPNAREQVRSPPFRAVLAVLLQLRKRTLGGVQGDLQLRLAMGDGGEAGLECRRCQIHAAIQHQVEKAVEATRVAGHHVLEGLDCVGAAEVQTEHAAHLGRDERN